MRKRYLRKDGAAFRQPSRRQVKGSAYVSHPNTFRPRFWLPSTVSSFDGPRDAHKHKAIVSARFRGTTTSIGFSRRLYSRLTFLTCLFELELMLAMAAIGCLSMSQRRM